MRILKILIMSIIVFAGLHFSFMEVQAEESDGAGEYTGETQGNSTDDESDTVHITKDEAKQDEIINESTEEAEQSAEGDASETESSKEKTTESEISEDTAKEQAKEESESSKNEPTDAEEEVKSDEPNKDESKSEEQEKQKSKTMLSVKEATMPYKEGDRHTDLKSIKKQLNAIGFGGISETDFFGSWTETRVKQFQGYYGLAVTGEINKATADKINKVYTSSFQLNKRHNSTIELKEKLNALGYGHISVSNLYGSWTKNRVEKFQRENGLRVNGIADDPTWAKINQLLAQKEFKVGDRHPNIVSIKQKLNKVGFDGISETDYYGNWTKTRVTQFQKYYGLSQTGTTNKATLDKLDEIYNSPFQLGKRHESTIDLKEKLNSLGYGHITVSNLYGSWTVNRVKKFQDENGLRVNGIMDEKSWSKLYELLEKTEFKVGNRHPNIIPIKQKLNTIGFGGISETNYFGNWMKTRVIQFQKYYGLSQTGTTNATTIDKLNEVYNSPYQLGKRHKDSINLKKKLNRIGFGHITVTELYGSFTKKQVEKFQKQYGLKVNGIADPVTQKKINDIYNSPLQKGKRNAQVIDIKRDLNRLGYDGISLTNYFGSWTETRLKQFQKDNNLPVSGIADVKTINKLKNSYITIYIDPGHGAHDPGGSGYGLKEKDVVLDIGKKLAQELRGYAGVEVILSRTKDEFLSLSQRTSAANNLGVNFFISLHTNALNGSANGFESFIYNGSVSQETKKRQSDIHNHLASWLKSNNGINDRGAKSANFHVLRETTMPSLLLEYMFIDNKKENNLLKNKSYRDTLGKITAEAIAKSFNLKKK
ncbi:peptidoglycan-binding protein [Oceanobacillus sp. FSL H7-0719]|uniref:peptidoglycan-binding protein n=1 Tax=Oceanobacillus sp. FSL H7-0719 TaxID=2954507 RepID=UPI003243BCB1